MAVLTDTPVIADALHDDPQWGAGLQDQRARHFGQLWINPVTGAALCCAAREIEAAK